MLPQMLKPQVFIGSSSEAIDAATQLLNVLSDSCNPLLWKDSPSFAASSTTIESLERAIDAADFAVFIFAPDDQTISREKQQPAVRDNVLFEFSLFLGHLGRKRVFGVACSARDASEPLKIPSDLFGVNMPHYRNLSKDELISTMRKVGANLLTHINREGHRERRDINLLNGWKLTRSGKFVVTVDAVLLQKQRHRLEERKLALIARKLRKSPVFLFDKGFVISDLYDIPRDDVEFEIDVSSQSFADNLTQDDVVEGYLLGVPVVFSKNDLIAMGNLENIIRAGCDRLDGVGISASDAVDE
jgi:predicted nucleotide-binding protein